MKEQYVKPLIFFESYSLTQTIARDCGDKHQGTLGESNHYNADTCEWVLGDMNLFFEDHCDFPMDDEVEIDGLCYNNPEGGQQIFSSI